MNGIKSYLCQKARFTVKGGYFLLVDNMKGGNLIKLRTWNIKLNKVILSNNKQFTMARLHGLNFYLVYFIRGYVFSKRSPIHLTNEICEMFVSKERSRRMTLIGVFFFAFHAPTHSHP